MNKQLLLYYITTGIIFLMEGLMPLATALFAPQYMTLGTKPLGYPDYFAYSLIIAKVLGAIALVWPKLSPRIKEWAYAGFTFNLIFASISHFAVDGIKFDSFMPLIVLAILGVSYQQYHKHFVH